MPMTTRSAARVNTEQTDQEYMDEHGEQAENTCSTVRNENFAELIVMIKQQTELIMEHKDAQTVRGW